MNKKLDKKYEKIGDKILFSLHILVLVTLFVPFFIKSMSFVFLSYAFFALAFYYIIHAYLFKKSTAIMGIVVGEKNNAYIFWAAFKFFAMLILGIIVQLKIRGIKSNMPLFVVFGVMVIVLGFISIVVQKGK